MKEYIKIKSKTRIQIITFISINKDIFTLETQIGKPKFDWGFYYAREIVTKEIYTDFMYFDSLKICTLLWLKDNI
jgi:hypothetical protein